MGHRAIWAPRAKSIEGVPRAAAASERASNRMATQQLLLHDVLHALQFALNHTCFVKRTENIANSEAAHHSLVAITQLSATSLHVLLYPSGSGLWINPKNLQTKEQCSLRNTAMLYLDVQVLSTNKSNKLLTCFDRLSVRCASLREQLRAYVARKRREWRAQRNVSTDNITLAA